MLTPERFVTDSPAHLLRGMLRAWPLHEQRAFFEDDLQIPLALEEESGKLFPRSNKARDVRDALVAFARSKGVEMLFETTVTDLQLVGGAFTLDYVGGERRCDRVVARDRRIVGAGNRQRWHGPRHRAALGHRMIDTYPALTPLLGSDPAHASLSGVSLNVRLRAKIGSQDHRNVRRVSVYASRLQRSERARYLASDGPAAEALAKEGPRDPRAVVHTLGQ